jgi:hypothetical protein
MHHQSVRLTRLRTEDSLAFCSKIAASVAENPGIRMTSAAAEPFVSIATAPTMSSSAKILEDLGRAEIRSQLVVLNTNTPL